MHFDVKMFEGLKALVAGDFISDVYHFGHADRLSPEAPVPVFVQDSTDVRPGGAGHVAAQLEALGCEITRSGSCALSVKRRYIIGHHQVFRHDSDVDSKPSSADIAEAVDRVGSADVVVLSDYNKGWLSYKLCTEVIAAAKRASVPVVVDPKTPQWDKFHGANVMCPNSKELREMDDLAHSPFSTPRWDCYTAEKRAEKGLRVHYHFGGDEGFVEAPATAQTVFDVTGAGDIVTAIIAACTASNKRSPIEAQFPMLSAARLANLAAGYAVGQVGTAVCPKDKLQELACGLDL